MEWNKLIFSCGMGCPLYSVYSVPTWRYLGSKKTFSIYAATQLLHISHSCANMQYLE